ncbi:MAG: RIP metalloprotease RseP [Bacilli bacterium]|nr:RIP metalloprotease RseP [Bacilli bacterium]MBN2877025.1 RIP metalloprotease RseP [Bacilli bacterium]
MLITLTIWQTLGNILIFLLVLSLVINIHELGHLFFAKRAGILCHEFAFGMGPRIWKKKVGETVYSIRAIPFGGFVSMAGEEIESDIIKIGQKIRLGFDSQNQVNRIILNAADVKYHDFLEIQVESYDLSSEEGTRLFINEYTVNRKAMYVDGKTVLQIAPKDRSFTYKSKRARFAATFGGPLMNFVLAFFVFLIMAFFMGVPNYDSALIGEVADGAPATDVLYAGDVIVSINGVDVTSWTGDTNSVTSELGKGADSYVIVVERDGANVTLPVIFPQYVFYGLGFTSTPGSTDLAIETPLYMNTELLSGDIIVSINGVTMTTWDDVITYAASHQEGSTEEDPTVIVVNRDGEELTFSYVAYGQDVLDAQGYDYYYSRIGITVSSKFSFFGSFGSAWTSFSNAGTSIFKTIGLMFSSNQVGVGDLSGFIGIFSMTSQAAAAGIFSLLSWVGFLSVNLGIVNLLPIPALDGGRLVFIGYEAITRRKPNQKFENWLHTIMFFLLMGFLIFITYNDIVRLFG